MSGIFRMISLWVFLFALLLLGCLHTGSSRPAGTKAFNAYRLQLLSRWLIDYHKEHGHWPSFVIGDSVKSLSHSWRVLFASYQDDQVAAEYRLDLEWNTSTNSTLGQRAITVVCNASDDQPRAALFAIIPPRHSHFLEFDANQIGLTLPVAFCDEHSSIAWNEPSDDATVAKPPTNSVSVLFATIPDLGSSDVEFIVKTLPVDEFLRECLVVEEISRVR